MRRGTVVLLASILLLPMTGPAPAGASGDASIDAELTQGEGPRSVIVSFHEPPTPDLVDRIEEIGTIHHVYHLIDAVHATVPTEQLSAIAQLPNVWRIDADEPLEWHLDTSRPAVQVGQTLWDRGIRGSGTTIAVVDTGIDGSHPGVGDRLAACVVFTSDGSSETGGVCTDRDGHGTHVAGITGGDGGSSALTRPDDARYAGMAIGADLVSLDISQSFTTSTAIRAFEWVHDNHESYGISVVQNSWGRKDTGGTYDADDPANRASNALVEDDLLLVFSAGNAGPDPSTLTQEAMNPNVLTVAAVDDSGETASFSSRGPVLLEDGSEASWTKPDVAAPGVGIRSAAAGQQKTDTSFYTSLSGTSQAAPHVAGIAALIRAEAPDRSMAAVVEAIESTSRDLGFQGPDPATGFGVVRAPRALDAVLSGEELARPAETYTSSGTVVTGSPVSGLLPEDSGSSTNRANGTFPVKPGAQRLNFTLTWVSSQDDLPAPDLRIRLTDPQGRDVVVPTTDQRAHRSLSGPVSGAWAWEAVPASEEAVGTADYEMKATIQLAPREPLRGAGGGAGFSDDSFQDRADRFVDRVSAQLHDNPLVAGGALVGVLLLLGFVRFVRRD